MTEAIPKNSTYKFLLPGTYGHCEITMGGRDVKEATERLARDFRCHEDELTFLCVVEALPAPKNETLRPVHSSMMPKAKSKTKTPKASGNEFADAINDELAGA